MIFNKFKFPKGYERKLLPRIHGIIFHDVNEKREILFRAHEQLPLSVWGKLLQVMRIFFSLPMKRKKMRTNLYTHLVTLYYNPLKIQTRVTKKVKKNVLHVYAKNIKPLFSSNSINPIDIYYRAADKVKIKRLSEEKEDMCFLLKLYKKTLW